MLEDGAPEFLWEVGRMGLGAVCWPQSSKSSGLASGPHCLPCPAWVHQSLPVQLHRCPKEMGPHVSNVTSLCLQYMKHDPNYNYDSDGEEEQMETEDSEFSEQGGWPTCHWSWRVEMSAALLGPPSPAKDGPHLVPLSWFQLFLKPCLP